jgi:hypothetical protein
MLVSHKRQRSQCGLQLSFLSTSANVFDGNNGCHQVLGVPDAPSACE